MLNALELAWCLSYEVAFKLDTEYNPPTHFRKGEEDPAAHLLKTSDLLILISFRPTLSY